MAPNIPDDTIIFYLPPLKGRTHKALSQCPTAQSPFWVLSLISSARKRRTVEGRNIFIYIGANLLLYIRCLFEHRPVVRCSRYSGSPFATVFSSFNKK